MHLAARAWQQALDRVDRWFAATAERHPGVIPCRSGCSACCHGPFDISVADALLLEAGLRTLPDAERTEVVSRAERLFDRMRQLAPDWAPPWDIRDLGEETFDELCEVLADEPCPLLDSAGACRLYPYRPLVCRLIGLPMLNGSGEILENACPIQERWPAYVALAPVPCDLEALEVEEAACLEAAALARFGNPAMAEYETTIAALIAG